MSFLGNILSGLGSSNSEHAGIAQSLLAHIQDQPGGLAGLVQQFRSQGLGQQVDSWVGTGQNQPVSPDQVEQGFGSDQLQALAARAGVSSGVAKTALAAVLPMIVDHLTPNGQVPEQQSLMQRIGGMLSRKAS